MVVPITPLELVPVMALALELEWDRVEPEADQDFGQVHTNTSYTVHVSLIPLWHCATLINNSLSFKYHGFA